MLGLILDTMILMVLIRLITGDDDEGWAKPALIAVLSAAAMIAASIGAAGSPENALLIVFGAIAGVGVFVALGCRLLLNIEIPKSALIGIGFVGYKIAFSLITFFVLG